MTDDTTTKKRELKPLEVGVGAGAAVITAFASSYLGTAGTLTGAALASVVGTVSTSVLRTSADRSAERLRQTTTRIRETRTQIRPSPTDIRPIESASAGEFDPYGTELFGASDWIDPDTDRTGSSRMGSTGSTGPGDAHRPAGSTGTGGYTGAAPAGEPTRASRSGGRGAGPGGADGAGPGGGRGPMRPRWVVLGAGAVIAFAVALVAITGIESAAGKPLAGLVGKQSGGGTTLGRATGSDSSSNDRPSPTPTPTPSGAASPTATGTPSGSNPTGEPSATAPTRTPSATSPAPTTPVPTQAPSTAPAPLTSATP